MALAAGSRRRQEAAAKAGGRPDSAPSSGQPSAASLPKWLVTRRNHLVSATRRSPIDTRPPGCVRHATTSWRPAANSSAARNSIRQVVKLVSPSAVVGGPPPAGQIGQRIINHLHTHRSPSSHSGGRSPRPEKVSSNSAGRTLEEIPIGGRQDSKFGADGILAANRKWSAPLAPEPATISGTRRGPEAGGIQYSKCPSRAYFKECS